MLRVEANIYEIIIRVTSIYFCTQLKDLLTFVCIMAVVIISYGVASQALRFPHSDLSPSLIIDIVYLPYWQVYGELSLNEVTGEIIEC